MITYFSNDAEALIHSNKAEYLPRWAMDEGLYNCESAWKFRKGFLYRTIISVMNLI